MLMKKILFILLCSGLFSISYAQSNLQVDYDDAGNRIQRKVIVLDNNSDSRLSDSLQAESYSDDLVSIYPNPSRYFFNLEFSNFEDSERIYFQLYDEQGRFVLENEVSNKRTKVDIASQPNGIYILNINRKGKVSQWQIVKVG